MGRVSVHGSGAEVPQKTLGECHAVPSLGGGGHRVKQDLVSALEELLVLGGGSHAHSTSPGSAHLLSIDARAEREGFPGQALQVAGEDG